MNGNSILFADMTQKNPKIFMVNGHSKKIELGLNIVSVC